MGKLARNFILFALILSLNGCSDWDDLVDSVSGSGDDDPAPVTESAVSAEAQAEPEEVTAEADTAPATESNRYHHYSSNAWELGTAVAMVFCYGTPTYERCELNGTPMNLHGVDEGRDVWAIYGQKGLSGELVCERAGERVSFSVENVGMQYGSCN